MSSELKIIFTVDTQLNQEMIDWQEKVDKQIENMLSEECKVFKNFMAKHGCGPEEVEKVFEQRANGQKVWFLRKRESPLKVI